MRIQYNNILARNIIKNTIIEKAVLYSYRCIKVCLSTYLRIYTYWKLFKYLWISGRKDGESFDWLKPRFQRQYYNNHWTKSSCKHEILGQGHMFLFISEVFKTLGHWRPDLITWNEKLQSIFKLFLPTSCFFFTVIFNS